MGIVVQPGTAMVIGYHNEETELGHGLQLTNEGNILIGTWHSHTPWDVDLYHTNALGESMFSQIRDGKSVGKEKVQRVLLADNTRIRPMMVEYTNESSTFENKVSHLLRKVSSRC